MIKKIAPDVLIIDITHGIPPQQVQRGALALADALPYMPVGVHVAVVDPGVGGHRRPLAVLGADGRLYVGPDNGLLLVAADRLGGVERAVEISNPGAMLELVSPTFHGRDVFAPAAAHLAKGMALDDLGEPVDPDSLVRLELALPRIERRRIQATVLAIDRFGNVRLNITPADLARAEIETGDTVEVEAAARRCAALVARTFADVGPGEPILYEDSARSMALAINRGSAARLMATLAGQEITLSVQGP